MSVAEAADRWGISQRRVRALIDATRILGAQKVGRDWIIPADAEKPKDARFKAESE